MKIEIINKYDDDYLFRLMDSENLFILFQVIDPYINIL